MVMKIRKTITTECKEIKFQYDGDYYVNGLDKSIAFQGYYKDFKYCVCYTKIVHDKGLRSGMSFGSPCIEHYDNGLVGYQNFNFFNDETDAKEDFKLRKKLTTKVGVIGYADVFLIKND